MKKDVLVAAIFISIIVVVAVVGAIMHHTGKTDGKISTTDTNTSSTKTTNDTTLKNNLSIISGPEYTLYYFLYINKTSNTTVVEEYNDSYTIILNGVLNYPPYYLSGNYTITSISISVAFPNGTTKYVLIPVYQNVKLSENPERFYLYLHGNSPALSTLYYYIQYLLRQGVDSVSVTFNLMQDNEFTLEVQGELYL